MEIKTALSLVREKAQPDNVMVSYFILKHKDIDGVLNFEEDVREISILEDSWILKEYTEHTTLSDEGATISKARLNERITSLHETELLELVSSGKIHVQEIQQIINKVVLDVGLPEF
ncbi:hypothetical protein QWY14_05290 [Planococcus sp. N028]|uniref:Uncharacterized protein n=1 Tax=Planococcus shixiaomingii TaxID=3058393 RepID=A0ABT8N0F1_9BACL|nr:MULTISPECIES: hypothetical protein [unclassified Planococcus (in: firmicutes)]MDN7241193.1 hypothetical protein [Planococcus sp. N028]WKA53462.1 hypothetical protein QWY21_12405 [Planococcus sp. N022]